MTRAEQLLSAVEQSGPLGIEMARSSRGSRTLGISIPSKYRCRVSEAADVVFDVGVGARMCTSRSTASPSASM